MVVDGSNIATEGRETPSLAQLDEAVRAFLREYTPEISTIVVDATFPNRIDASERQMYEDALAAGELITPPAGAVGRGDAFVLEIADRAGAVVLSNDSFREFHGQYAWLFTEGRLIGGKPVPHVGWVFMDRSPVRGPASLRAVSTAGQAEKPTGPKAAASQKAASKKAAAKKKATKQAQKAARQKKAEKKARPTKQTGGTPNTSSARKEAAAPKKASAKTSARKAAKKTTAKQTPPSRDHSTRADTYNDREPFDRFVRAHPVGSKVRGIVDGFGSHGAQVVCGNVRAYAPLKNLADTPPRSAKDVLKLGETRRFVVAALDHEKRGVDLALPGVRAGGPERGSGGQ